MNLNKIFIAGNLTRDPKKSQTADGGLIVKFTIAVNEKFRDREDVSFVAVTTFGRIAEIAMDSLQKGSPVMIEGRLKQERWVGRDQKHQTKTRVYADKVQCLKAVRQ